MKIYYRNKTAKLTRSLEGYSCKRCPFHSILFCPYSTSTIGDCEGRGWWVDGESSEIFNL